MLQFYKIIFFFFLISSCVLNAQVSTWARTFSEPQNDYAYDIAIDAAGNSYAVGTFQGTIDFDPGPGTFTLSSLGAEDVFIIKLNVSGNFVWAKQFKGDYQDRGYSIAIDSLNNIYTCGTFNSSSIDLDPGPATYTLNNSGGIDIFISKLDSLGNFIWGKKIGDSGNEVAYGINLDSFDNVYLTGGYSSLNVDFDPGPGTFNLSNPTTTISSGYVIKLNSVGSFIWAKKTLGSGGGNKIGIDNSGNVYSLGTFSGIADDFDPGVGTYTMSTYGSTDIFLSKLDSGGNFIWAKQFGGPNQEYAGFSFKTSVNNDIYIFGLLINPIDIDPGPAVYNLTSTGGGDAFITKLDSNGNFNWAGQISGPSAQQAADVEIDNMNNIYLFGTFSGLTDLDPTNGTYTVTATNDLFITKIDALGNFITAQHIGETTNTGGLVAFAFELDAQNNIYACGHVLGTVDFDPTANTNIVSLGLSSGFDIYVCKMVLPCTIPQPPTQVINPSNSIYCNNISNTLTATCAGNVTWHSTPSNSVILGAGNNYITPLLTQGVHTFYAQSNSCTKNTSRTAITITVNPVPQITISSSHSVLCAGEQAVLQCNGANSFSWSTLSPSGQITISPTVTTSYSVVGTAINGCSNTVYYTQNVAVCNYIRSNNYQEKNVKLFPNPGTGIFNIEGDIIGEMEIFTAMGQKIFYKKIDTGISVLDLREFQDGIYFIKIKDNTTQKFIKIIKEQ